MVTVGQSIIQPVVHKAFADADHRVAAHLESFCNLLVSPPRTRSMLIDFQEDTGMGEFASGSIPLGNQLFQNKSLVFTSGDFVLV
jgi:hypothetical protein